MKTINLVEDNKEFFRQLKRNAIKKGIKLNMKWAKIVIILGLKLYLGFENKKEEN